MTDPKPKGESLGQILAEMKKDYVQNFPRKIEKLKALYEAKDQKLITEEFHKLKGTGKTYGFPEVSMLFEALETYGRYKTIEWNQISSLFSVLNRMQEAWLAKEVFDLKRDPEAHSLLKLKSEKPK